MPKILYIILFITYSLYATIDTTPRNNVNLEHGTQITDLPYGYYDSNFQSGIINAFDQKDLSAYTDKFLFTGYGVYDKSESNCKFIDLLPLNAPIDANGQKINDFNQTFTDILILDNKTYARSVDKMSYTECKALTNNYNGYIFTPQNELENEKVSDENASLLRYETWIGYSKADCSSQYLNDKNRVQTYDNFLNSNEPCDINKLNVYKPKDSSVWLRSGGNLAKFCPIQLDSPDYNKPFKICAPWWKVHRSFKDPNEGLTIAGRNLDFSYLKYSTQNIPKNQKLCGRVNTEYTEQILANAPLRDVFCKGYYDAFAAQQCAFQLIQPTCWVDRCEGYIKSNHCHKVGEIPPLPGAKNYQFAYDKSNKKVKIKDQITTFMYKCPALPPPTAKQCLRVENALIFPKECQLSNCPNDGNPCQLNPGAVESDCDALKECILNESPSNYSPPANATEAEIEASHEAFTDALKQCEIDHYCEAQYGVNEKYDSVTGELESVTASCNNGLRIESFVGVLNQTEKNCVEFEEITEVNISTQKCEADMPFETQTVNLSITEQDIYQDQPNCIRTNDVFLARPESVETLDYTNRHTFKTVIKQAYLDTSTIEEHRARDTNLTLLSSTYIISRDSDASIHEDDEYVQENGIDLNDTSNLNPREQQLLDDLEEKEAEILAQCSVFFGPDGVGGAEWKLHRLSPFFTQELPTVEDPTGDTGPAESFSGGLKAIIPTNSNYTFGVGLTKGGVGTACGEYAYPQFGQLFQSVGSGSYIPAAPYNSAHPDFNITTCNLISDPMYDLYGPSPHGGNQVYDIPFLTDPPTDPTDYNTINGCKYNCEHFQQECNEYCNIPMQDSCRTCFAGDSRYLESDNIYADKYGCRRGRQESDSCKTSEEICEGIETNGVCDIATTTSCLTCNEGNPSGSPIATCSKTVYDIKSCNQIDKICDEAAGFHFVKTSNNPPDTIFQDQTTLDFKFPDQCKAPGIKISSPLECLKFAPPQGGLRPAAYYGDDFTLYGGGPNLNPSQRLNLTSASNLCYMVGPYLAGDEKVKYIARSGADVVMELNGNYTKEECEANAACLDMDVDPRSADGGLCILVSDDIEVEPPADPTTDLTPSNNPVVDTGSLNISFDGTKDVYSIQEYAEGLKGWGYFTNYITIPPEDNTITLGEQEIFPIHEAPVVNKDLEFDYAVKQTKHKCKNDIPSSEEFKFETLHNIVDPDIVAGRYGDGVSARLAVVASIPGLQVLAAAAGIVVAVAALAALEVASFVTSIGSVATNFAPALMSNPIGWIIAIIIAIVIVVVVFFADHITWGELQSKYDITEPIPQNMPTSQYESRLFDSQNNKLWYDSLDFSSGLIGNDDFAQGIADFAESKRARFRSFGFVDASPEFQKYVNTVDGLNRSSTNSNSQMTFTTEYTPQPNPKSKKFRIKWCKRKVYDSQKGVTTIHKPLKTIYMEATNAVNIVLPYKGDFEVKAYDRFNNLLATRLVRETKNGFGDFITFGGVGGESYARVNFALSTVSGENSIQEDDITNSVFAAINPNIQHDGDFTLAPGIIEPKLFSDACLAHEMVEWGGGVSGVYYEEGGPYSWTRNPDLNTHICSKSNDEYVKKHSATKITVRPTNYSRAFVIDLVKPLPYPNRVYLVHLGKNETREYKCYADIDCEIQ